MTKKSHTPKLLAMALLITVSTSLYSPHSRAIQRPAGFSSLAEALDTLAGLVDRAGTAVGSCLDTLSGATLDPLAEWKYVTPDTKLGTAVDRLLNTVLGKRLARREAYQAARSEFLMSFTAGIDRGFALDGIATLQSRNTDEQDMVEFKALLDHSFKNLEGRQLRLLVQLILRRAAYFNARDINQTLGLLSSKLKSRNLDEDDIAILQIYMTRLLADHSNEAESVGGLRFIFSDWAYGIRKNPANVKAVLNIVSGELVRKYKDDTDRAEALAIIYRFMEKLRDLHNSQPAEITEDRAGN